MGLTQQRKPRCIVCLLGRKGPKVSRSFLPLCGSGGAGGRETVVIVGWEGLGVFMEEAGWDKALKNS